jgi:cytochrome c biogenesis protein CcmG, thiol:disulfide interchange protein DsbE
MATSNLDTWHWLVVNGHRIRIALRAGKALLRVRQVPTGPRQVARPYLSDHEEAWLLSTARRPWTLLATGVLALAAGAWWITRVRSASPPAPVAVGSAAPAFRLPAVRPPGATRGLADYAGHPLLINFWATWCQPCREEMPSLERLYRADSARGLRIVAVSIDDRGADSLISTFISSSGLTFDVLHDAGAAVQARYQVRGIPQTLLVAADGRIVGTQYVRDWASPASRALVDSLLLGGAP